MRSPDAARRNSYQMLGVFLALSAGLGAVGYRYYAVQRSDIEANVRDELSAIADLKVRQVAEWRRERLAAARIIASTQSMPAVSWLLAGRADAKARGAVLAWMEALRETGYANAILVNLRGKVCLAVGRGGGAEELYAALVRQVLASGDIVFSDLHRDSGLAGPHLGLNIPLRSDVHGPMEGILLLGIDPSEFLYPLIQSWPTPSRTAETLLVRREGDEVVYLNELRHRKDTAMQLRFPLTDRRIPAVRGALGVEGTAEGIDYRGVRVLAAIRRVPDSPWVLVAKVDADEIYAQVRAEAIWLALMIATLMLAVGTGLGLLWHRAQSSLYQQRYEAELQEKRSRALLNSVIEATSDMVYVKDTRGRYLLANGALCRKAGLPPEDILGRDDKAVFAPSVAEAVKDRDNAIMAGGPMKTEEEELIFKTGETVTYLTATAPLLDENGSVIGLFGIGRDVTDRKRSEEERSRLQEQLQGAQRMESIGRLAGGVAHDFNNLLTVINGYADLVLAALGADSAFREPVSEIGKAGERAAALTQQLLAFSRKQVIELKVIDLNNVIRDASKMLRRIVGEDIEVITGLAPSPGYVLADAGQLHQVLMNLAVNARDAMPGGGTLVLETGDVDIGDDVAERPDVKAGPYVLLTVADTGLGMDEATRQRAFEPFFTTKPKGHGTGLGLATVYGIVQQSGGWVRLYSEPGKGTAFKVYLPRVAGPADAHPAVQPASSLHGTETVLVVEDQAAVRKVTTEILRGYGYDILEVANGDEALLLSERFPDPIHLMITDVIMPGITGRELAVRLAPLRPAMKVLYISGYPAEIIARQGVLEAGVAFLSKPFTQDALAGKVRALLTQPGAQGLS